MAIGTFCERRDATGGMLLLAEVIEGAGEQDGDRAGGGDGGNAVVIEIFDVVDRQGPIARGELGATEIGELLGVKFDGEPEGFGGLEDLFGLCNREGDALAKRIDCVRQILPGRGWKRPTANEIHIASAIFLELLRKGMGAEEGGNDIDWADAAKLAGDPKHAEFGIDIQAVA